MDPFKCDECGCAVIPTAKDGRYYLHRQVTILVPADFLIPKCTGCGTEWLGPETRVALEKVLEEEFQEHAHIIQAVVSEYQRRSRV